MKNAKRVLEIVVLTAATLNELGGGVWGAGGPPPPPSVPVGGIGSFAATAVVIVGYGIWKSRR